jgi:hypothetical protein
MANRIYFANQQVAFRADGDDAAGAYTAAHGVQSVAVTTTFNLEQAFELGQLSIYENIEGVPDIEVTMSKVLDGYPLLYTLATKNNGAVGDAVTSPTLAGRSNEKSLVAVGIWPDTFDSATGSFPLEDNFTEDITLVGNDKAWVDMDDTSNAVGCSNPSWQLQLATGEFRGNDEPLSTASGGGINRRENLAFAESTAVLGTSDSGVDYCRFPTEIPGVDSSGWMSPRDAANTAHLSSVTVSTDLGREELFELGTRQPYARVVTFPIEVTCDIEMISLSGDMVNAFADGCGTSDPCTGIVNNLTDQIIRVATCEGTRIYLGAKNKLASVNYGGGDAGGGNVSVTYSYTNFNDCTVMHEFDPSTGIRWVDRKNYLG